MSNGIRPISFHQSGLVPPKNSLNNALQNDVHKFNGLKLRINDEIIFRSIATVMVSLLLVNAARLVSVHLVDCFVDLLDRVMGNTYEKDPVKFVNKLLKEIDSLMEKAENSELKSLQGDIKNFLSSGPKAEDREKYEDFVIRFIGIKNQINPHRSDGDKQVVVVDDKASKEVAVNNNKYNWFQGGLTGYGGIGDGFSLLSIVGIPIICVRLAIVHFRKKALTLERNILLRPLEQECEEISKQIKAKQEVQRLVKQVPSDNKSVLSSLGQKIKKKIVDGLKNSFHDLYSSEVMGLDIEGLAPEEFVAKIGLIRDEIAADINSQQKKLNSLKSGVDDLRNKNPKDVKSYIVNHRFDSLKSSTDDCIKRLDGVQNIEPAKLMPYVRKLAEQIIQLREQRGFWESQGVVNGGLQRQEVITNKQNCLQLERRALKALEKLWITKGAAQNFEQYIANQQKDIVEKDNIDNQHNQQELAEIDNISSGTRKLDQKKSFVQKVSLQKSRLIRAKEAVKDEQKLFQKITKILKDISFLPQDSKVEKSNVISGEFQSLGWSKMIDKSQNNLGKKPDDSMKYYTPQSSVNDKKLDKPLLQKMQDQLQKSSSSQNFFSFPKYKRPIADGKRAPKGFLEHLKKEGYQGITKITKSYIALESAKEESKSTASDSQSFYEVGYEIEVAGEWY